MTREFTLEKLTSDIRRQKSAYTKQFNKLGTYINNNITQTPQFKAESNYGQTIADRLYWV